MIKTIKLDDASRVHGRYGFHSADRLVVNTPFGTRSAFALDYVTRNGNDVPMMVLTEKDARALLDLLHEAFPPVAAMMTGAEFQRAFDRAFCLTNSERTKFRSELRGRELRDEDVQRMTDEELVKEIGMNYLNHASKLVVVPEADDEIGQLFLACRARLSRLAAV